MKHYGRLVGILLLLIAASCSGKRSNNDTPGMLLLFLQKTGIVETTSTDNENNDLNRSNFALILNSQTDIDANGRIDSIPRDIDGNGVIDSLDANRDGQPDQILLDTNNDGRPDAIDKNADGQPDYYACDAGPRKVNTRPNCTGLQVTLVDENNDGRPDGYDIGGDGLVDDPILRTIQQDTDAPLISVSSGNPPGAYATPQRVTLQCSDDSLPGYIVYTLDGSAPSQFPFHGRLVQNHSAEIEVGTPGDGTYELKFICVDMKGRTSSTIGYAKYTLAAAGPGAIERPFARFISGKLGTVVISESYPGFRIPTVGTRYSLRDGGDSCVTGTSLVEGITVIANQETGAVIRATDFSGDGQIKNLKFYAYFDTNGNNACDPGLDNISVNSFTVTRDDTPPVLSTSPGTGFFAQESEVAVSCMDGVAGCADIAYEVREWGFVGSPDINATTGEVTSGTRYTGPISLMRLNTKRTLAVVARDRAGNLSLYHYSWYLYQTSGIQFTAAMLRTRTQDVNVDWRVSQSGTYSARVGGTDCSVGEGQEVATGAVLSELDGGPDVNRITVSNTVLTEGVNVFRLCITPANSAPFSGSVTLLKDITPPAATILSPTTGGNHPQGTILNLGCADSGVGCLALVYTLDGTTPTYRPLHGELYQGPVVLPSGVSQIRVIALDSIQNVSAMQSLDVTIP